MDLFTGLSWLGRLWEMRQEISHVAEFTGLSITALIGCAIALYLGWQSAVVRRATLMIAAAAITLYFGGMFFYALGASDKQAAWDEAKVRAAAERKRQDAEIETKIRGEYLPQITALQNAADDRNQQVASYEQTMRTQAALGGASCRLGPEPLRLRTPKAKR